ncbi:MAG: glycosyltransferase [Rhodopirellula sp.]|nr:glycosyltransferase [Rhodopirellula sp.]
MGIDQSDSPPMSAEACVIVVPCYNEAARLDVDAFTAFARHDSTCRFVFVDDGSRDATAEVLSRLCETAPDRFRMMAMGKNCGKAEAVRQGVLSAMDRSARFVGYWDADLATPLDAIASLRQVLEERPEVRIVLGSRVRLLGRRIERRAARHYMGRLFATAASLVLNLPVYDTQCGAKVFRVTEETRQLFSEPFGASWAFDVELLARYLAVHGRPAAESPWFGLYEVPLDRWQDVAGSKLSLSGALTAFRGLGYVYRRYRNGGSPNG